MARRHKAEKRKITPDARFNSEMVAVMINHLMQRGKKSVAQSIVYGAIEEVSKKIEGDPMESLARALDNVKPRIEVKSRRVGGATYQVPVEVSSERQMALALRWIRQYARARKGISMSRALAAELVDAYNNQGAAIKKRDDTHKMAQANKAFAHYRW
ncbi:MAG: 30S ribosomal protein S7 [Kiritimatiellia bacterium]|nr:30S ribosomal protein S7 [Kiritimatiellia bacterium]